MMARRLRSWMLLLPVGAVLVACGGQPSAMEVCKKLESVGVASNCRQGKKVGPAAVAKERAEFDVPAVAGRPGEVLTFAEEREYLITVSTYNRLGTYNGLHRYGSKDRLVFTAFNEYASPELAEKAKKVIEEL
jgi:hypothetical protein